MTCDIKTPEGVRINGSKFLYGGGIQSVSLSVGGLASQQRASVSVVGPDLQTPQAGDLIVIKTDNMPPLNMQVGGYNIKSSAGGATSMTVQCYDLSNELDNLHIVLKEEIDENDFVPDYVQILGTKWGIVPDILKTEAGKEYGVESATPDTTLSDVRHTYEQETEWCPGETEEQKKERIDSRVKSTPGKVLWRATGAAYSFFGGTEETLESALKKRNLLTQGSVLVGQMSNGGAELFDFKGTFRDVIVQYANTMGLQAYWDMTENQVHIAPTTSASVGLSIVRSITNQCEALSVSQSEDFTTTMSVGAIGNFTANYQAESQRDTQSQSRYLEATLLQPKFKYSPCRAKNKEAGARELTELDFSSEDTLKAISAAIMGDKIYAGYALQAGIAAAAPLKDGIINFLYDEMRNIAPSLCSLEMASKANKKVGKSVSVAKLQDLLPLEAEVNKYGDAVNQVLKDYYTPDPADPPKNESAALLTAVEIGDYGGEYGSSDIKNDILAFTNAEAKAGLEGATVEESKESCGGEPKFWNNTPDSAPFKYMGPLMYSASGAGRGVFEYGQIFIKTQAFFDTILNSSGLAGGQDLMMQYLKAIKDFKDRFYVVKQNPKRESRKKGAEGVNIKGDSTKIAGGCEAQSLHVTGRDYGYYLTSEAQGNGLNLDTNQDATKVININPFVPISECGNDTLINLCKTLAMMYLPPDKKLSSVMGLKGDPNSPVAELRAGETGAAVIDFIYALESDSEEPPEGEVTGLELFFNGDGNKADPVRRAEFKNPDDPEINMHLVEVQPQAQELDPRISFLSNVEQREQNGNQNEVVGEATSIGPTQELAETLVQNFNSIMGGLNEERFFEKITSQDDIDPLQFWGLRIYQNAEGDVLNFHGNIPDGFGPKSLQGKPFIPKASFETPDLIAKCWYDVKAANNATTGDPGDFTLTAAVYPKTNCWKSKFDFGVAVNAADLGRDNGDFAKWYANATDAGNVYSKANQNAMKAAMYRQLSKGAVSDETIPTSLSVSFILHEDSNMPRLPKQEEGLESFSISLNGNLTEISVSAGNTLERQARKAMYERAIQNPSTQYRPINIAPDPYSTNTTPKFQSLMRNA